LSQGEWKTRRMREGESGEIRAHMAYK